MFVTEAELVDLIHDTPTKAVVITTGGGADIFGMLLRRGGGSATLLSGMIPYDPADTCKLLGYVPEKLVSEETARALAMSAYQSALRLRSEDTPVIGVATTSVLQRIPDERLGREHVIYAALQTSDATFSFSWTVTPELKSSIYDTKQNIRLTEEASSSLVVLNLVARGCGLKQQVEIHNEWVNQRPEWQHSIRHPELGLLMEGKMNAIAFDCYDDGTIQPVTNPTSSNLMMSGSFNPLHDGHIEMCEIAARIQSRDVEFEMSMVNVDKPRLDLIAVKERLWNFTGKGRTIRVWLTNAPTFVAKSALFPSTTFVVGYDTAKRIIDPKYAGDIDAVIRAFNRNATQFIVFGRHDADGVFHDTLDSFPHDFRSKAHIVSERDFSNSLSSTQLRRKI